MPPETPSPPRKPPSQVEIRWAGDSRFEGGRADGPKIVIDGDRRDGPGPVDTLMCALAACTGEDVLSILAKRRTPVSALRIEVEGIRAHAIPARVVSIHMRWHIDGDGIDPVHAERAVQLSVEKYCSVRDSLDRGVAITWTVEIERDGKR